jgi:hypothetical protein
VKIILKVKELKDEYLIMAVARLNDKIQTLCIEKEPRKYPTQVICNYYQKFIKDSSIVVEIDKNNPSIYYVSFDELAIWEETDKATKKNRIFIRKLFRLTEDQQCS